jgi:hypothetical protein
MRQWSRTGTIYRPANAGTGLWSSCGHDGSPSSLTVSALFVKLGNDTKTENWLAPLVGNLQPQFRASFNGMVQIAEDFAGRPCRLDLNRGDVGKVDAVAVVRRAVAMTDAEKIFGHPVVSRSPGQRPKSKNRMPESKRENHGLSVQNGSHSLTVTLRGIEARQPCRRRNIAAVPVAGTVLDSPPPEGRG